MANTAVAVDGEPVGLTPALRVVARHYEYAEGIASSQITTSQ